jgi:hypothetical protein
LASTSIATTVPPSNPAATAIPLEIKISDNTTLASAEAINLGKSLARIVSEHPQTFRCEEFLIEGFEHILLCALVNGFPRDLDLGHV